MSEIGALHARIEARRAEMARLRDAQSADLQRSINLRQSALLVELQQRLDGDDDSVEVVAGSDDEGGVGFSERDADW